MMNINVCPTCGSNQIHKVHRNWIGSFRGEQYTVPDLEFYECPNCGERIFDPGAMRRIQEYSPAYAASSNTPVQAHL